MHWRDQIADGVVPLRDIIDLESTHTKLNGGPITDQNVINAISKTSIEDLDLEDEEESEEEETR
jgi:RNA polymerase primary sigma factor